MEWGLIYSRLHNFIFLKGKKVAGTSVEMALASVCGPDDIITRIQPIEERARLKDTGRGAQNYSESPEKEKEYLKHIASTSDGERVEVAFKADLYRNHMSLSDFAHRFGSIPTRRIFCVERSPYAKIISAANMAGKFKKYKTGEQQMIDVNVDQIRGAIKRRFDTGRIGGCRNIDNYRDPDGGVHLRVLRFESLSQEFSALMDEYGIAPAPTLPHAKRGANSNDFDPKDIFTRDQIDQVNDLYAEEFDTFGYERL